MAEVLKLKPITDPIQTDDVGTDIPMPTTQHYDVSRDIEVQAPINLGERELDFMLQRDADKRPQDDAVGTYYLEDVFNQFHDIGAKASEKASEQAGTVIKGAGAFFGGLPNVGRALSVEQEERFQKEAEKPFGKIDFFTALDPSGIEGTAARRRIFNELLGRTDEKRIRQSKAVVESTKRAMRENEEWLRELGLGRPDDKSKQFLFDIGSGVGSIGTAVAITVATRNPKYAALIFGTIQKSEIYREAREAEFDPGDASTISNLAGIVEGAVEAVGGGIFLRLAGVDKPLRRIVFRALEESGQEAVQQAGEEVITQGLSVREFDPTAGVGRIGYAAAIGFIVGAPVATITNMVEQTAQQENVPLTPKEAKGIVSSLNAVKSELQTEGGNILDSLRSNVSFNEKSRKEAAEIIRKFVAGEEINFEQEFSSLSPTARQVLDSLVAEQAQRIEVSGKEKERIRSTLETDISILDREIESVSDIIEQRETAGQSVKTLNQRLTRLTNKRIRLEDRLSGIDAKPIEPAKPSDVAKASISGLRAGFRRGLSTAKQDIKKAQTALANLIDGAPLRATDKAKFLKTIKNIQTAEQLERRLPGIQSRVIRLLEADRKRTAKANIKKILDKKTRVRKQAGKPVGKFTPEIQSLFDSLRPITKMKKEEAAATLETNLQQPEPSIDAALENGLLAIMAGDSSLSASDIETLQTTLEGLVAEGATAAQARATAKRIQRDELVGQASEAVIAGGPQLEEINTTSLTARANNTLKQGKALAGSLWNSWNDMLDIIFNKKGVDAGNLIDNLTVHREIQNEKRIIRSWNRKLLDAGLEAFGVSNERQLQNKLARDNKRESIGTFTDAAGRKVNLQYSVSEARKLWMENQDPTINDAISSEEGNAYTQDMQNAIFGMLSQEDIAFARAQLEIYQEIYGQINEVYTRMYGVNLPFNPNYSPIQRDRTARPAEEALETTTSTTEFLQEQQFRRSVAPGGVKTRVANLLPLRKRSDIGAMHQHFSDMSHFIALGEKMTLINAVFGNPRLRAEIQQKHGRASVQYIDGFIQDMMRGHGRTGFLFDGLFNWFNRNFTSSVLALKAQIGIKQFTSLFAMMENIPVTDFVAGMASFAKNPNAAINIMWKNSPLLQERGANIDVEIARVASANPELIQFSKLRRWQDLMLIFVKLGDRAPIYLGGWAVYQNALKQGKSEAEAISAFEKIAAATQQSGDLDQLSAIQRSSGVARSLVMFMSAPVALMRGELRAIRQGIKGKISIGEFAKRMAIYHLIIPSFFTFIASGFKFDDEDQLRAISFGSFTGLLIYYDIVANVYNQLADEGFISQKQNIPAWDVPREIADGVVKAIQAWNEGDSDEMLQRIREISEATGKGVGLPVEQAFNFTEGLAKIPEGEIEEGTKLLLGWPDSVIEKINE